LLLFSSQNGTDEKGENYVCSELCGKNKSSGKAFLSVHLQRLLFNSTFNWRKKGKKPGVLFYRYDFRFKMHLSRINISPSHELP
jgi:hypothetical protein